jgi:hypothetical protein
MDYICVLSKKENQPGMTLTLDERAKTKPGKISQEKKARDDENTIRYHVSDKLEADIPDDQNEN